MKLSRRMPALAACALISLFGPSVCAREAAPLVASVSVPGTTLEVNLATQVGQPYDASLVQKDVHYLWGLGKFDDVQVEESERADGIGLVFHVKQVARPLLHEIRIEPHSFGLNLKVPQGAPIDLMRANQIAMEARRQLAAQGYRDARVDYRLTPAPHGETDLKLMVDSGASLRVKETRFIGGEVPNRELRALRVRRILPGVPFLWKGWQWLPNYSTEAVDADVARVLSNYMKNGYLDAEVRPGPVAIDGKDASVTILVNPGPYYSIPKDPCATALSERRAAQREGVIDFTARFDPDHGLSLTRGPSYRVGRIAFTGNHRFSDALLRSNFLLDEGAVLDERLLRRSIARLNRSTMFNPIDERNVIVNPNPKTGYADITVRVSERRPGAWNLSGPVGPMSLAGPIQASISSRLPGWGRGLLALSTYTVSISLFAFGKPLLPILNAPKGFIPVLALQRPYTPGEGWKSGFAAAPQLGWKNFGAGYGATQLQQRLLPLVSGERSAEPELPITVSREQGEAVLICEPPKPRLGYLRATAGLALHFIGALPVM